MTNEERIAEFMHTETWGYPWDKTPRAMKDAWREKARSLLTFLDSLGFVQKDEDQSYGFIWTDEAGVFIKYRCPDGFVRVKSILPAQDNNRCGVYADQWKELGKPEGWQGCSLPKGHSGYHTDKLPAQEGK
jgi:hypothetical protein